MRSPVSTRSATRRVSHSGHRLDRDNPAACLDALTDGPEQRIDLGIIGGRMFVNNASFGVPEIPVGIDGETVMMPTPVRCAIQPRALRVRGPRDRPGTRPSKPPLDWSTLWHLASFRTTPAGT